MDALIRKPVIPLQARLDWVQAHSAFFPTPDAVERVKQIVVKDFSVDSDDHDWMMSVEEHGTVLDELACRYMLHELQMAHGHELTQGRQLLHLNASTFAILHSLATWLSFDRERR